MNHESLLASLSLTIMIWIVIIVIISLLRD